MTQFILRRLGQTVVVVLLALTVVFGLLRLTGDPTLLMVPDDARPERIQEIRVQMGFDRPVLVQYWDFMTGALRGDFGTSFRYSLPAFTMVADRFPATVQLTLGAMLVAGLVGITLGVLAAVNRGRWIDHLASTVAILGVSIPTFWIGLMGILVFSVFLGVLPTGGRGGWQHLIMPVAVLAVEPMAYITKLTRSSVLEVQSLDYVTTARSKGLVETVILSKHVLRNAFIPVASYLGLQFSSLLGGAVVVETIFAWPGVGQTIFAALGYRDFPVVQVGVVMIAFIVAIVNLLVDLSYAWLDPRITYR